MSKILLRFELIRVDLSLFKLFTANLGLLRVLFTLFKLIYVYLGSFELF